MSRASGGPEKPQRNENDIPEPLRAMPVKVSINDGKIRNQTMMRKRLEWFGLVRLDSGS